MIRTLATSLGLLLLLAGTTATATELVYTPVNPAFGGNPLNGTYLLNNANAQNSYDEGSGSGGGASGSQSSLEQFNELLQRAILNRIASAITGSIVSDTGQLIPGTIETTDFIIVIADLGGGLMQITTTDKLTGQSTTFQIDSTL